MVRTNQSPIGVSELSVPACAGVTPCNKNKITPKYCAHQCMLWQAEFIYSGVAFKNECWCDSSLRGTGVNTKAAEAECSMVCTGDASTICGGTWFASLSRCGDDDSWGVHVLSVLVPGLVVYILGGVLYGRRNGTSSGGGASSVLASHPHWIVWQEVGNLCIDGLHYSRGGRGGGAAVAPTSDLREKLDGRTTRAHKHKSKSKLKQGKAHHASESVKREQQRPPDPPDPPGPPPAASTSAPNRDWRPTPRASHLSSGARETGVKIQM